MKTIRKICKVLLPKNVKLIAIDSTGVDSFRRSKHYEKRRSELGNLPHITYAKTSLLVDVDNKMILD